MVIRTNTKSATNLQTLSGDTLYVGLTSTLIGDVTIGTPDHPATLTVYGSIIGTNIDATTLQGRQWGNPLPIGNITPNTAFFTALTVTTATSTDSNPVNFLAPNMIANTKTDLRIGRSFAESGYLRYFTASLLPLGTNEMHLGLASDSPHISLSPTGTHIPSLYVNDGLGIFVGTTLVPSVATFKGIFTVGPSSVWGDTTAVFKCNMYISKRGVLQKSYVEAYADFDIGGTMKLDGYFDMKSVYETDAFFSCVIDSTTATKPFFVDVTGPSLINSAISLIGDNTLGIHWR